MKIKERNIVANVSWSPSSFSSLYLACGTAAHQMDFASDSSPTLQIYDSNIGDADLEMKLMNSVDVHSKFHKLIWGGYEGNFIIGGCDDCSIYVYNAAKLLGNENSLDVSIKNKHSGPVFSLDLNPFQLNLLASGSSESEIFIWDLNDVSSPMTPGTKVSSATNVTGIAWNKQVEHIMASTYGGRCVVFDLRKNSSIIQITDAVSRIKANSISWNPNVATQLVLTSDDDHSPYVQLWDLRFAGTPLRTFEGHQKSIIASLWCTQDPDILITTAKDSKTLVWNPNATDKTCELIGEFPSYNQWCFDMSWCNKDPSLVAAASVDGAVSIYSLNGGGVPSSQTNKFSAIADSFPGMEMPIVVPQTIQNHSIYLKKPPNWFRKPAGVKFAFGGHIISWHSASKNITVAHVVTEPELVSRASQLEEALAQEDLMYYCSNKALESAPSDQLLWNFIGAGFSLAPKSQYMELLGYSAMQVASKIIPEDASVDGDLANRVADLGNDEVSASLDPSEQFEMIASSQSYDRNPEVIEYESVGNIDLIPVEEQQSLASQALIVGDLASAVEVCLQNGDFSHALILASFSGAELFSKTQKRVLRKDRSCQSVLIEALVNHELSSVVDQCPLSQWKEALVTALTYGHENEFSTLAEKLGERLEVGGQEEYLNSAIICYYCSGNIEKFVSCWIKTHPYIDSSSEALQNLIELVMIIRRAMSSMNQLVDVKSDSLVNHFLCKYASLLASQGALSSAITYLNNAQEGEMLLLKERLQQALRYQMAPVAGQSANSTKPSNLSQASSQFRCPPSQPQQMFSSFCTPSSTTMEAPPMMFMTPGQVAPMPPPPQISAPSSGFVPPMSGYGVPPAPGLNAPVPSNAPVAPPPPPVSGSIGLRKSNMSGRYISAAGNAPQPSFGAVPTMMNVPAAPTLTPVGPPFANNPASAFNTNTAVPSQIPQSYGLPPPPPPPVSKTDFQSGPPMSPNVMPNPGMVSPRGWNDPPEVSRRRADNSQGVNPPAFLGDHSGAKRLQMLKARQQHQEPGVTQPLEPITSPVVGSVTQQPPPQHYAGYQGGQTDYPACEVQDEPAEMQVPAAPRVLPPEHKIIQDVLDTIRNRALLVAQNQVIKQRLEDLGIKIDILYDKLMNNQLSGSTVGGLHSIVQAIQQGDYPSALRLHTATVASGNFAEMSQFMPPLKMLLTTCMQLQVFLN